MTMGRVERFRLLYLHYINCIYYVDFNGLEISVFSKCFSTGTLGIFKNHSDNIGGYQSKIL